LSFDGQSCYIAYEDSGIAVILGIGLDEDTSTPYYLSTNFDPYNQMPVDRLFMFNNNMHLLGYSSTDLSFKVFNMTGTAYTGSYTMNLYLNQVSHLASKAIVLYLTTDGILGAQADHMFASPNNQILIDHNFTGTSNKFFAVSDD
jgi:hypothetical protein